MQTEIRQQGEIIHLLTSNGFIQIIIQGVNRETGQVKLEFITPKEVSIISSKNRAAVKSESLESQTVQD